MERLRTYGRPPFGVAVLHGGPGAPGGMAPVARELASAAGVLEPLQTAASLEGQVAELTAVLERHATLPATVIGWSWGAWLGFILAARQPSLLNQLVLVGSGPFEERYAEAIMATRLARLSGAERLEVQALQQILEDPAGGDRDSALAQLGKLLARADSYDPLALDPVPLKCQYDVYQRVWQDARELRRSGKLLELGKQIRCPVVAIHGDYDPHPAEGVLAPLSLTLSDFTFVLLDRCGHEPWIERHARDRFYATLGRLLGPGS